MNLPYPTNNIQQGITNLVNQVTAIGLKQINGFDMVREFKDSDGRVWRLVKSARDSSVEIPDPQFVQITDYWVHEFPNSNGKVFIYVVEGIKRPRIDTETPVMVLYQWFSTNGNMAFTPQMITQAEWYNANVYTSSLSDTRISKLNALCKVTASPQTNYNNEPDIDISLINGNRKSETTDRKDTKSHKD